MHKYYFDIKRHMDSPHTLTYRVRAKNFDEALAFARADAAASLAVRPNEVWVVRGGLED